MKKKLLLLALSIAFVFCGAVGMKVVTNNVSANAETQVITAVKGDSNGFVTDAEWATAVTLNFTGANEGTVKLVTVGVNLFFKYEINDTTKFTGKDKIAYTIETDGVTQAQQGNFDPWLTPTPVFGSNVQTEFSYDETNKKYIVIIGVPLGEHLVAGAEVNVKFEHYDVTVDTQSWGEGEKSSVEATMKFESKSETVDPEPVAPVATSVIPSVRGNANGFVTDDEWAIALTLNFTGANEGTVKLATVGTNLFFKYEIKDVTNFPGKDRIAYTIETDGVKQALQGNFDPWLTPAPVFGANVQTEFSYDETSQKYIVVIGVPLGDHFKLGGEVKVVFEHNDVTVDTQSWGDGAGSTINATLKFAENTPGPENVDLGIVVVDIPNIPKESDWAKATAYNLIPNTGNLTGATGTIKILTAANNIYYRVEINDPTTNVQNDYKYVYLGTEDAHYEARGNYKNWLALKTNTLGKTPSLMEDVSTTTDETVWTEGVLTFTHGFYIPELYATGNTIRLVYMHGDSRSDAETWKDGGYAHTIYFDQIITFGEPADVTVRPEEAFEGFTAGSENISYNKASVTWNEFDGAVTYKMYVYEVNGEDAEEPYTHIAVEGPVSAGSDAYSETIYGLTELSAYAVQVIAYDEDGEVIGCSELSTFTTISRQQAIEGDNSQTGSSDTSTSSTPNSGSSSESEGCVSAVGVSSALAIAFAFVAFKALKKKED